MTEHLRSLYYVVIIGCRKLKREFGIASSHFVQEFERESMNEEGNDLPANFWSLKKLK
jgi:hypothetical protein